MAQSKKMNEASFAKLVKETNAVGELIRARQDEKQAIMDDFDKEKKRYRAGRISEKALESSVKKTNKELARLDKEIRTAIARVRGITDNTKRLTANQAPKALRVEVSGIKNKGKKKKKKVVKKKPVAKKRKKKKKSGKKAKSVKKKK